MDTSQGMSTGSGAAARLRRQTDRPATENERPGARSALARVGTLDLPITGIRVFVSLGIAALVIAALYFGRPVLVPLALALLLSFVLNPVVMRLKRWGLPKVISVVSVVAAALLVLGVAGLFVGNEVRVLSAELPSYQSNIRGKLRGLRAQIRAPGMFEGARKTFDVVQSEVAAAAAESANGKRKPAVQKVQVVPTELSPVDQAWAALARLGGPLSDAALVLVFVIFILLDREDLRDRLLRLWGQNLHRATDALDEAGARISRYLGMQLLVNVSYGIPMAAGLWFIGVPGALLWGAVAAVMRFVPYVGPLISAVFPLALAFAVAPGWELVLWTAALIVVLELISNNIIEPWLYGASTGLSAMSLIFAATFWTAMWGPIGLIMSTPLTVCLLVIGRYLPQLSFLDVLLGSQPVLDEPTRIYQRLLAGDADEAGDISLRIVEGGGDSPAAFYSDVGGAVLRMAVGDHARSATAEHRLRVVDGMDEVLDELEEQYPAGKLSPVARVLCMGGKSEVDQLAARMVAHGVQLEGHTARLADSDVLSSQSAVARPDLVRGDVVCVSWMSSEPRAGARALCRRIRRAWPDVGIVLHFWNLAEPLTEEELTALAESVGADRVALSYGSVVACLREWLGDGDSESFEPAPIPRNEEKRCKALDASGAMDSEPFRQISQQMAKRASDIFDIPLAYVSLVDGTTEHVTAMHGGLRVQSDESLPEAKPRRFQASIERAQALGPFAIASDEPMQVHDLLHDPRFAGNPIIQSVGARFYAAAPIREKSGLPIGVLSLVDSRPRELGDREMRLLQAMANDVMQEWKGIDLPEARQSPPKENSATVGQDVPG
jgi:predicted PurR-regulated permease PerM